MLWLYVSIGSSRLACSSTAVVRGVDGSGMDSRVSGFGGLRATSTSARSDAGSRGTAVKP